MPTLRVNLETIGQNTEAVARLLRDRNLALVAVTKGCLGDPRVAAAMLEGGAIALADTRESNLERLRNSFPEVELHRIYLPSFMEPSVLADIAYVSSLEGAARLADLVAASFLAGGKSQKVMIMVESGDLREGVPKEQLADLALFIASRRELELVGLATNYACFQGTPSGVLQSAVIVAEAAGQLRSLGYEVPRVSGGNSSLLGFLVDGCDLPKEITELRCGEALLLGHDALYRRTLPGCRGDGCVLRAEVVERYTKRTVEKESRRVVLAVGRQDLGRGEIAFVDPWLTEVGRSSDYLVAELDPGAEDLSVGCEVEIRLFYEALVAAWSSPYVKLEYA
ncbi:MAG: alanine racemase [Thermoleophilia bacterium]|nr:alanine racemase [Thermoleophilia bacterium]